MSASDNSSHHIYLYGGFDPISKTGYDDVLILTLPSFTWTNVWPVGEAPRWGHNCHVAGPGKRQMITVGGNNTNGLTCDWEAKGVAVWEMSTLTWGSVFLTNLTSYEVPKKILDITGGTATGNATKHDPALGWTDPKLQAVFATSRRSTSSSTIPTSRKKHTGAIAGGVVGALAALALVMTIAIILIRRHRSRRGPHELHNDSSPSAREEKFELQAVNENEPAELFSPDVREMDAPRQVVEADHMSTTTRAELPGMNVVPGGVTGVPIVRTPGDELPESPEYTPGLKRVSQERRRSGEMLGGEGGSAGTK
jgi:hypothetical protein